SCGHSPAPVRARSRRPGPRRPPGALSGPYLPGWRRPAGPGIDHCQRPRNGRDRCDRHRHSHERLRGRHAVRPRLLRSGGGRHRRGQLGAAVTLLVEDLVALRGLVDSYAAAVDAKDRTAFVALFTPGGVLRVQPEDGPPESRFEGPEVARSLDVLDVFYRTFHHVGGAVFTETAGGAQGQVHCLAHHYERTSNGPVDLVMMIRYLDRYARAAAGWLIADRQVVIDWTELHPAHPRR